MFFSLFTKPNIFQKDNKGVCTLVLDRRPSSRLEEAGRFHIRQPADHPEAIPNARSMVDRRWHRPRDDESAS